MKHIILLNGEPYKGDIDTRACKVICCDGALNWASSRGIEPDMVIGDFDSLGYVPENAVVYEREKNFSDGEAAVGLAAENGAESVEIYGAGGGRDDHFFVNVHILKKAFDCGIDAKMYTNYCEIFFKDKPFALETEIGTTLSLVPVTPSAHIINSTGLKYPLHGLTLTAGGGASRGLSNVACEKKVHVELGSGILLVFLVLDEYNN